MSSLPLVADTEIELTYFQNRKGYPSNFNGKLVGEFLTGTGEDDVGEFVISGAINISKKTIKFEKRYIGRHIVLYNGKLGSKYINANGKWSIGQATGDFKMKLPKYDKQCKPIKIKAEYYQRKWSPFDFPAIIERTGEITGYGKDTVGEFAVDGVINVSNSSVYFEKRYINQHIVVYNGRINKTNFSVNGHWFIGAYNDKFRMQIDKNTYNLLKSPLSSKYTANTSFNANSSKGEIYQLLSNRRELIANKIPEVESVIRKSSNENSQRLIKAWDKSHKAEEELLKIFNNVGNVANFMRIMLWNESMFNSVYTKIYKSEHNKAYNKYKQFLSKLNATKKITNNVKNNDFIGLYFDAAILMKDDFEDKIEECLDKMRNKGISVDCSGAKIKGVSRAFYKTYFEYDGDINKLTDLLRCSFVFKSFEHLYSALEVVHKEWQFDGGLLRIKNRFIGQSDDDEKKGNDGQEGFIAFGYRDVIANVYAPNSDKTVVCELQFHHEFFYENKKPSHEVYKTSRLFEGKDKNLAYEFAKDHYKKEIMKTQKQDGNDMKLKYLGKNGNIIEWKGK